MFLYLWAIFIDDRWSLEIYVTVIFSLPRRVAKYVGKLGTAFRVTEVRCQLLYLLPYLNSNEVRFSLSSKYESSDKSIWFLSWYNKIWIQLLYVAMFHEIFVEEWLNCLQLFEIAQQLNINLEWFKYRSKYESWQRTSVNRNVVPNFLTYFTTRCGRVIWNWR